MTIKTDLEAQVEELTRQLKEEQQKIRNFAQILGQMRYRIFEVLELEPETRTKIVDEIDTVFNRAL